MKKSLRLFDRRCSHLIARFPPWLRPAMLLASLIGEPLITFGIAVLVAGIGIGIGHDTLIISGAIAVITIALTSLLKLVLRRKRPKAAYVTRQILFDTFSFPSGHAAGSVVSFGLLGLLLIDAGYLSVSLIIGSFLPLLLLIGISRVFLQAHYPSDVVGGWLLGLIGLGFIALEFAS